ncbi:MAG: hypothetical protein ACK46Q_11940 [Hyphomonas sp.]
MPTPSDDLAAFVLANDDLKRLGSKTLRKVEEETSTDPQLPGNWLLLEVKMAEDRALILRIAKLALEAAPDARRAISEDWINRMTALLVQGERAPVDLDIDQDNARMRADYLKTVPAYTAAQVREFQTGDLPVNPSDPAARWKRESRIFAIPEGRLDLFPAFQFADGAPRPEIRAILKALPEDMTDWQRAFWFASVNGWLDGRSPQDSLDNVAAVVSAAGRLRELAIG